ncbi:hypothetical protein NST21_28590 [Peribacillus sp. FSL K6-1552]|uniref:hypothetical protein n=1 Tax=Peribacillus sp. FSL K6-1552 TaxID=2954514 RepID=UPI0030FC60E1
MGNHILRKTFGYWFYQSHEGYWHAATDSACQYPSVTPRYIVITEEETNNVLKHFSVFH